MEFQFFRHPHQVETTAHNRFDSLERHHLRFYHPVTTTTKKQQASKFKQQQQQSNEKITKCQKQQSVKAWTPFYPNNNY